VRTAADKCYWCDKLLTDAGFTMKDGVVEDELPFCSEECVDGFVEYWPTKYDILTVNPNHPDNKKYFEGKEGEVPR